MALSAVIACPKVLKADEAKADPPIQVQSFSAPRDQIESEKQSRIDYLAKWLAKVNETAQRLFPNGLPTGPQPLRTAIDVFLRADGKIEGVKVIKKTRYDSLDEAILRSIFLSEPFNGISKDMGELVLPMKVEAILIVSFLDDVPIRFQDLERVAQSIYSIQEGAGEHGHFSAEQGELMEIYAKRPRSKFLSAATSAQSKYATYIDDWSHKVKRAAELNFPDSALHRSLPTTLILDVAIMQDGTIVETQIRRSSGNQRLDDACKKIVYLAAPFAAFPATFRNEFDILHITRTWEFTSNGELELK